jgi:hypothetical protein
MSVTYVSCPTCLRYESQNLTNWTVFRLFDDWISNEESLNSWQVFTRKNFSWHLRPSNVLVDGAADFNVNLVLEEPLEFFCEDCYQISSYAFCQYRRDRKNSWLNNNTSTLMTQHRDHLNKRRFKDRDRNVETTLQIVWVSYCLISSRWERD